ncbi:SDR family NAD(P)-dependent oxidoreductase [Sandaracinus amylolyticus]|uniref:SDR family NAD(P)-dependent oxidoreductase n=1 Tax=Sandaracinus amylolyticus TaxID=927083 RepID=UPI001F3B5098|nr:SDR family NAD(P)-dependent oxidoreductase [Sandaracinus amylolyticus]UJR86721.1 Hypothetical protein I5071_88220 [Sandaracinus amylolyticus]
MNDTDRVWLVTGASSGFGRSIVEEALRRGDRVVATARRTDALADLARSAPDRVLVSELDVTRHEQRTRVVSEALARFGAIDVLVNNAGYSILGAVEETSDDEVRAAMEVLFFAPVALTREVLPSMRARGRGTVVQITSVGGITTAPGFGPYCAAKHAVEALSESLAAEVQPFGVRVVIVEPGAFRTSLFGTAFRQMPAMDEYAPTVGAIRTWSASVAGAQAGDPDKAARAIVDAVQVEGDIPLRLPLGGDAIDGIRAKLARIAADVERAEPVARATAFDGT